MKRKISILIVAISLVALSANAQMGGLSSPQGWRWVESSVNGEIIEPNEKGDFIIFFNESTGRAYIITDCNDYMSEYSTAGDAIGFQNLYGTKMYCSDSKEFEFTEELKKAETYAINNGQLIIYLKNKAGTMIFK